MMASEAFAISGTLDPLVVPLAISFFTFQQIALLIDVKEGHAKISNPLDFAAFIALFRNSSQAQLSYFERCENNSLTFELVITRD